MRRSLALIILSLLLIVPGCPAAPPQPLRPAAVAGQFYAADSAALELGISRYLERAVTPIEAEPVALIVPHAGHGFCGQIIADAMRQAEGLSCDLIVILGTNHTTPGFHGISIYPKGGFQTPLGISRIAEDAANELIAANPQASSDLAVHEREHSIEVVLPFVQHLLPRADILPVIVATSDLDSCRAFGQSLAAVLRNRKALIIASSDLSHYPAYRQACRVDSAVLHSIETLDPGEVQSALRRESAAASPPLGTCACGEGAILTAISAARELGADHARVLSYANSGDASIGDYERVVGYGAVALARGQSSAFAPTPETSSAATAVDAAGNPDYQQALLTFARETLVWQLSSQTSPLAQRSVKFVEANGGAFVTLKINGELRGCIGHTAADMPLSRTVGAMTLSAALEDRRFRPVESSELNDITIEISAVTPLRTISDPSEIVVGRDGVLLRQGRHSAVYLPQVATEQGWNRDDMLDHLCLKAGLTAGSWKKDTEFRTFQTTVFSETDRR
jgi:AmmeMemoRadiSam system protein B/AmmeMemoRadiSam system protein A